MQFVDHVFVAHLVKACEEIKLDHRQGFEMQLWEFAFERREKIGVVLEGKFAVQAADDVQLGRTFGDGVAGDLDAFFDRMRVRTFLPGTLVKAAKFAVGDADVRVVEVAVDVVIRRQPVLAAANRVGQLAESVEVGRVVKRDAFVKGQPFAVLYFFR